MSGTNFFSEEGDTIGAPDTPGQRDNYDLTEEAMDAELATEGGTGEDTYDEEGEEEKKTERPTGGPPIKFTPANTNAQREQQQMEAWVQEEEQDDEEAFFNRHPAYLPTHMYIPYDKRTRWGQGQQNLLIPLPSWVQPLYTKIRSDAGRATLMMVKYGDTVTQCDIFDISVALYSAVLIAEYQERTQIQWANKRATGAWLSLGDNPTDIKSMERKFEGRNDSGQIYALETYVTGLERAFSEMTKALKAITRQHPVYEEVDKQYKVLETLTQLCRALQSGKEPMWKRWALTKDHSIHKASGPIAPTNKAEKVQLREKAHFLNSATHLAQFVTHLANLVSAEEERKKKEEEKELKIAVAQAAARATPTPAMMPPATAPSGSSGHGGGPGHGGGGGGGTAGGGGSPSGVNINLSDSQKKKQSLLQALAKIKYTGGLKLFAVTSDQSDSEKSLMNKLNEMDRCFKQHACDIEQEFEVVESLCDQSLIGAGFDRNTYVQHRKEEETLRIKGNAEMSCTLAIAALIRYFKANGYQHLCTGTLIGFEIFDLVSEQLQTITQLASVLTNVGTQYTLFYGHKSILLYFLSALHVYNKNKLSQLIQDCKTFEKVKHLNFLEMSVFESTTKIITPIKLWHEVMQACQRLDSQTASLVGPALTSGTQQVAHTQRLAGKRHREGSGNQNEAHANTPCLRWWANASCPKHEQGNTCPFNHDTDNMSVRATLLTLLRSGDKAITQVLRRLRKDNSWKLLDVTDREVYDAMYYIFQRDDEKAAAEGASAPRRGGRGGKGGGGEARGGRGGTPTTRGVYSRGGGRGMTTRGGGRGYRGGYRGRGYGGPHRSYARDASGWTSSSSSSTSSQQHLNQAYETSSSASTNTGPDQGAKIEVIE